MKTIIKTNCLKNISVLGLLMLIVNYTSAQCFFTPSVTPPVCTSNEPIVVHGIASGNGTGIGYSYGGGGIYIGKGSGASTYQNGYNLAIGNAVSHSTPVTLDYIPLASLQPTSTTSGANMGNFNLAIGTAVLNQIVSNSYNTGIGQNGTLVGLTDGDGNTAVGAGSMMRIGTGSNNAAFGINALIGPATNSSGSNNTAMGPGALATINGGSNNVGLGYIANVPNGANSNQLSIQNTIYGLGMYSSSPLIGINLNNPTATLDVKGDAKIWTIPQHEEDTRILCANTAGNVHWRDISGFPGGGGPCTWNILNASLFPGTSNNLSAGYNLADGACNDGFVSIGVDDVGATGLVSNTNAKLYVYNHSDHQCESDYIIGSIAIAGYLPAKQDEAGSRHIGVYGYGHGQDRCIGVYGVADYFCDDKTKPEEANIGVYGGPRLDNIDYSCDCEKATSFYAGYFAGQTVDMALPIIVSDESIKTKIEPIENVDEIISKLEPKTFYYKKESAKGIVFPQNKQYGFISQEVEKVIPDIVREIPGPVTKDEKGNIKPSDQTYKGMQYDALIAVLVKAVQNQNEKISELQEQINSLTQGNTTKTNAQAIMLGDDNVQQVVLYQNVPNPFAEKTTIGYQVPANAKDAEIRFYNQTGYLIKAAQLYNKGKGTVEVFGNGVAAGVYTYVLYVDGKVVANKKMVKQ